MTPTLMFAGPDAQHTLDPSSMSVVIVIVIVIVSDCCSAGVNRFFPLVCELTSRPLEAALIHVACCPDALGITIQK